MNANHTLFSRGISSACKSELHYNIYSTVRCKKSYGKLSGDADEK